MKVVKTSGERCGLIGLSGISYHIPGTAGILTLQTICYVLTVITLRLSPIMTIVDNNYS